MGKKIVLLFILGFSIIVLSGCASLNGDVPFRYQPSLISYNKKIDKTVGLNMLVDKRPDGDKAYTESIKDVSEKITAKLLEDFDKSKIFKEIHYPSQAEDDIVINGTIDRFMWKFYAKTIYYIPMLNLVCYFGVPYADAYGIAGITLEVRDNKVGKVLWSFAEESKMVNSYTFYNMKAGDSGAELAEAFREVGKKLKEDLLIKTNF
ncbi:MAG: hypothetical protein COX40_03565 [Candidatus Omnitrophica bacterium CG23_combo_of_CG06-09_8_20_14_all_40_11]|nr:MAG: hypothetical protein COX40_03565 [Candidatus Omnitrophica bacterium CG23_combo_of_CG06-09_8_20_14_all_40_11]